MTISISDKLTSDHSEKYTLSIRLRSGGLSFSVYSPCIGESLYYKEVDFDASRSAFDSLKEFFFAHDFLSWNYKKIYMVCVSSKYTLVPTEMMSAKRTTALYSFNCEQQTGRCLSNTIKEAQTDIVYTMDDQMYEFCSRSLVDPQFVHYMAPPLALWSKQSVLKKYTSMQVVVHDKLIDIVCISPEKLLFVNTFEYHQIDDIVYYILYVWKHVGLAQADDTLFLMGNLLLCNRIIQLLQVYLKNIERMEIPSEAYLIGGDIARLPFDLIALVV